MLRSTVRRLAPTAFVVVFSAALTPTGCGDFVTPSDGGAGVGGSSDVGPSPTSSSSSSGGGGGAHPPPRPQGAGPGDASSPKTFAITHLYVGERTRSGVSSASAWAQYGFDLDGIDTTTDFSTHCKPAGGASPSDAFPDGDEGRDNAFGKQILPLLKSAAMGIDLEQSVNAPITNGTLTWLFDLSTLGSGASYDPIAAFYLSGESGTAAGWEMKPESLNGSTPETAKQVFPMSYLVDHTWVSGPGTVDLALAIGAGRMHLHILSAVVAMDLTSDHGAATNGTIAGVLETEAFAAEVRRLGGRLDTSLCTGATIDSVVNRVRQASDIGADGHQVPSKTCDGISVGLGFNAVATSLEGLGAPEVPESDPCSGP